MPGNAQNPLLLAFRNHVIPWIVESGVDRLVLARASLKAFRQEKSLPLGMRITRRPLQSRRMAVRGRHEFGKHSVVNARWPKDGLHSLRTQKICIVLNGEITFQCGDAVLHCLPGHIIFIPPDIPHPDGSHNHLEETSVPHGNCDLLFMGTYADGVVVWLSHTRKGVHRGEGTYGIFNRQTKSYFDLLLEEMIAPGEYARQNSGALLTLLMTSVYRELQHASYDLKPELKVNLYANTDEQSIIARSHDYILQHLHKKLTINEVARHVYLSRTQFTSLHRRETGKSFNEFLSECRFEKAKVLLLDQRQWSISKISSWVGLKPGMLRKLFHQRLDMSPMQFRQLNKTHTKLPGK
jgi:AraC-like DNA-binding protein